MTHKYHLWSGPSKRNVTLIYSIRHLPEPESLNQDKLAALVNRVGDQAFHTFNFIGVWAKLSTCAVWKRSYPTYMRIRNSWSVCLNS